MRSSVRSSLPWLCLVQSSVLQADIKRYEQIILDEEAKLDPSKKSMSVLIGESLVASNIKIHDLIVTWTKRVDQPVSKIEFRQHIGKLVDGADPKQIDALFESLDEDNSGTLSLVEIRSAMAKFQGDASAMIKTNVLIKAKIEVIKTELGLTFPDPDVTFPEVVRAANDECGLPDTGDLPAQVLAGLRTTAASRTFHAESLS